MTINTSFSVRAIMRTNLEIFEDGQSSQASLIGTYYLPNEHCQKRCPARNNTFFPSVLQHTGMMLNNKVSKVVFRWRSPVSARALRHLINFSLCSSNLTLV